MENNIIFLDIDGVLNSLPYFESLKDTETNSEIDESKLPLLKRIVEENNAQIVLSSTWKELDNKDNPDCYAMWKYLIDSLAKYGMKIISKTPTILNKRPIEIKAWLDSRPDKDNIKWISIDDDFCEEDYEECGLGGHLIQTKFFTNDINDGGLQEKHVLMAKELFNKQK